MVSPTAPAVAPDAVARVQLAAVRLSKFNGWAPFLLALTLAGPFCFSPVAETDLGWHLALGRLIAQGDFPRTNALAWTYPDLPWYPTSWLFDWVCYRAEASAGIFGIQLGTFALFAATLAAVAVACKRVNPKQGAWLVPVIALLLVPRVTPRPHMFSWAVLATCIALCTAGRRRGWAFRAACVPLIAIGSNFHAGAIFSAIALGVFCAESIFRKGAWGREVLIAIAGFAALMANPGGSHNLLYATWHLRVYELVKLSEFQTPLPWDLPSFYLLIPLVLACATVHARKRPAGVVLALGFALGGIWAARLAFKFFIVGAPICAAGLPVFSRKYGSRVGTLLGVLLILTGLGTNARRFAKLELRPTWDRSVLPVRATEFIRSRGLDGRFFNSFGDGGFLEYALPSVPAFQDARVNAYPPDFFPNQLHAERSPAAFDRYLRESGVEWALIQYQDPLTGSLLLDVPGWALVYWDDENEVLVRRDVSRFGQLIAENEFRHFHPSRTTPGSITAQIVPLGPGELLAFLDEVIRFQGSTPDDRYALLARCALTSRMGATDAASWCEKASALATDGALRALVERARHLTPLHSTR